MTKHRIIQNFLITIAVLSLSACEPIKYTLTGGKDQKGAEVHTETKMSLADGNLTVSGLGGSVTVKMGMDGHSITTSRVLEVDHGKATTMEVFHEKDISVIKTSVKGQTETKEQPHPLHATTVIRRLENGKWTEALKSGQPTEQQRGRLKDTPDSSNSFYPERAVTIGETWNVPPDQFKRFLGSDVLTSEGSMNCTFVRVGELDGQKCAIIMATIEARGSTLDDENREVKMVMSGKGTVYRSLRDLVDIKIEMRGTMKLESDGAQSGQKLTMTVTGPFSMTETNAIKR